MAALNELDVSALVPQQTQEAIKRTIALLFWKWYEANKDDKLTRISLFRGLIKKTVYLRDLKPALELLFGPNNGLS